MFKLFVVLLLIVSLAVIVTSALAQPPAPAGNQGSPGAKPAPGAPMSGPGAGPPGMAIPKDIAHSGGAPRPPNTKGTTTTLVVIAAVVVVIVFIAWAVGRKKR